DRPINDGHFEVELKTLGGRRRYLLFARRVGDVEVLDARAAIEAVIAGLEHVGLEASALRVEEEPAMSRLNHRAPPAGREGYCNEHEKNRTHGVLTFLRERKTRRSQRSQCAGANDPEAANADFTSALEPIG